MTAFRIDGLHSHAWSTRQLHTSVSSKPARSKIVFSQNLWKYRCSVSFSNLCSEGRRNNEIFWTGLVLGTIGRVSRRTCVLSLGLFARGYSHERFVLWHFEQAGFFSSHFILRVLRKDEFYAFACGVWSYLQGIHPVLTLGTLFLVALKGCELYLIGRWGWSWRFIRKREKDSVHTAMNSN